MTSTTIDRPGTLTTTDRPSGLLVSLLISWAGLAAVVELVTLAGLGWSRATSASPLRMLPIFHLSAEWLMAVLPAVGGMAWWREHRWGPALVLFGFGTWIYAVANATSWAVVNEPILLVNFAVSLFVVAFFGIPLIRRPEAAAFGPRTRWRTAGMIVLVVFMLQIFGVWTMYFIIGEMSNVFTERADLSVYFVRTLTGELVLVASVLVSAWGWHRHARWAPGLLLFAAGVLFYAGLNNLSLAVVSSVWSVFYCAATVVIALVVAWPAYHAYGRQDVRLNGPKRTKP